MRPKTKGLFATTAVVTAFFLTACSGEETADSASGASLTPETCEIEPGNLRVYLNPWGATLTDEFTEETGIATDMADLGGGEILARISAEANNPQWDVVILDGHGSLEGMREAGQLYKNPPVAHLDRLNEEALEMMPEDIGWVPISKHAAGVIVYNTNEISPENAPKGWDDLMNSNYAPVGIADPAIAAPAYPIVSWFFENLGTDKAEEYFEAIQDNGLSTYEKNGPVGKAVASGAVKTAMMQEQHLFEMMEDGEPLDFVWPDEGAPGVVRAVAISGQTPRPCASAALVDWILDADHMTYLMENGEDDGVITPFIEGTDTSSLPPRRPNDPKLNITDARFAAENEAQIKDWFANLQLR